MQNILILILITLAVSGCTQEPEKKEPAALTEQFEREIKPTIKQDTPVMITLRGTVRYKDFEGGFWGLDANNGNKYMPTGLNEALLVDGIVVEVTGTIEEDGNLVTFQQYGKIFKVKESKIIDDSNTRAANSY